MTPVPTSHIICSSQSEMLCLCWFPGSVAQTSTPRYTVYLHAWISSHSPVIAKSSYIVYFTYFANSDCCYHLMETYEANFNTHTWIYGFNLNTVTCFNVKKRFSRIVCVHLVSEAHHFIVFCCFFPAFVDILDRHLNV